MTDRKVRKRKLGTALGLYVAFCVFVGLGNVISALGRGHEAVETSRDKEGSKCRIDRLAKARKGGQALFRAFLGVALFVLLAGVWACLWVPLS
jgi:hypothetical protein